MKIEKNVPVPTTVTGKIEQLLSEIKVRDSFLIEEKKRTSIHVCVNYGKERGKLPSTFKLKTRKEGDKVRVWRVN